jgi:sec-independent protein translocase protein TatA
MGVSLLQLLLILLIVLLLFGAGKLPKVMSDLGKGLKSFKSAINEEEKKDDSSGEDKK